LPLGLRFPLLQKPGHGGNRGFAAEELEAPGEGQGLVADVEPVEPLQVQGELQHRIPGPEQEKVVPAGVHAVDEGVVGGLLPGLHIVPPKPVLVGDWVADELQHLHGEEPLQ